jgi:hypothetical protein
MNNVDVFHPLPLLSILAQQQSDLITAPHSQRPSHGHITAQPQPFIQCLQIDALSQQNRSCWYALQSVLLPQFCWLSAEQQVHSFLCLGSVPE